MQKKPTEKITPINKRKAAIEYDLDMSSIEIQDGHAWLVTRVEETIVDCEPIVTNEKS